MRSYSLSYSVRLLLFVLAACSGQPKPGQAPAPAELDSVEQRLDLLAGGAAGWVATGGASVSVEDGHLVFQASPSAGGTLTKTLNGANRVDLTATPTLSVSASSVNALFNLFCDIPGLAAASFLRSNAVSHREAMIAPPGAGLRDVTLTLFVVAGGRYVFDRMSFIADTSSATMPATPVLKSGNMHLDIPLDSAEAARWSFAAEEAGQSVVVTAQNGRLAFDGRGMVRRVFIVDLQQLPNLSVAMAVSSGTPQPVFNLGTYVNSSARTEFLRSEYGPRVTWKAVPDAGTGAGQRRLTVEILLTGGHYELSSLSFQGNYQEIDLLANNAAGWTAYGGATFEVDPSTGNLVVHGPASSTSGNAGIQRFLTGTSRVNLTTYPALSVRATSTTSLFNLLYQVGTNPSASFMRAYAASAREAVIAVPQAGEQNLVLVLGVSAGSTAVFDRIRLTSNATSAEMPAAVQQGGLTHVDIPLDVNEASRWSFVPEAADNQLQIRGVDGKVTFDGKGIAKRVFLVDLAQTPQLLANMSAVTGTPLPVFNLGTSVNDTGRVQFLRSDNGPRSIQATISNPGTGTGLRKVEMDIIFTGGHHELSKLDFTQADACPNDPTKTQPGACGCGRPDVDNDQNGVADCSFLTTLNDDPGMSECTLKVGSQPQSDMTSAAILFMDSIMPFADYLALAQDRREKLDAIFDQAGLACAILNGDVDGDLVPDSSDTCPQTPPLTPTDDHGCTDSARPDAPDSDKVREIVNDMVLIWQRDPGTCDATIVESPHVVAGYINNTQLGSAFVAAFFRFTVPGACPTRLRVEVATDDPNGWPVGPGNSVLYFEVPSSDFGPAYANGGQVPGVASLILRDETFSDAYQNLWNAMGDNNGRDSSGNPAFSMTVRAMAVYGDGRQSVWSPAVALRPWGNR